MGTWTVVVAFAGVGRSRLRVRVCVSEHVSVCVWVWVCKRARLRVCVERGLYQGWCGTVGGPWHILGRCPKSSGRFASEARN